MELAHPASDRFRPGRTLGVARVEAAAALPTRTGLGGVQKRQLLEQAVMVTLLEKAERDGDK